MNDREIRWLEGYWCGWYCARNAGTPVADALDQDDPKDRGFVMGWTLGNCAFHASRLPNPFDWSVW